MQEPAPIPDPLESDDAIIDGATKGVSSGHGVLASMLSWIRTSLGRGPHPGQLFAGVLTPELPHVDPKSVVYPERFDPALLMDALVRYRERYEGQLHSGGLLLALGQRLPPSAFPITESLTQFGEPLGNDSFRIGDYEDRETAIRAIANIRFNGDKCSGQLAWLVNAAVLRAAVSMAGFVYAEPRLEIGVPNVNHALAFEYNGETSYVNIDSDSSPLSLHRHVRQVIQGIWKSKLATETARVSIEFVDTLRRQGLPSDLMENLQRELDEVLRDFKPLVKMRHSSDAFINISSIARVCMGYIEQMDRIAVRNSLRHGTQGLHWDNYLAHLDAGLKAEIAQHESAGALAYARYSPRLLSALFNTNGTNPNAHSFSIGPLVSGGFGTVWGGMGHDADYAGHLTRHFMESLDSNVSLAVRAAFAEVSPRYLCVLAVGHPKIDSLEKHVSRLQSVRNDPAASIELAKAAGQRLAAALNLVATTTPSGRPFLPWTRVLSSGSCYELLTSSESDDRAISGLVNLVTYANARRAKGVRANDEVWSLPGADDCISAPAGNPVDALMGMHGAPVVRGWNRFEKAALNLVRDLVAWVEPVQTQHMQSDGSLSRVLLWEPVLCSIRSSTSEEKDLAGGFRLALRNPGTRKGGTWTLMDIVARTNERLDAHRQFRVSSELSAFAVRGTGTPEKAAPLVMEVRMPEPTRFRAMANRKPSAHGWSHLDMHDIGGCGLDNPHMANRIAECDHEAIPSMHVHARAAMDSWADRVGKMLARRPFQSAAAFPAVAKFLWFGGRTTDNQKLRQVGVATAFKLARACLGSTNPYGMGLLCRHITRPKQRSSSGATLLDMALDSTDYRVAQGAMEGLRKNSRLAVEQDGLPGMVQSSFGKLIERHPELIPLALKLGAKADATAMLAWSHLHPQRRSPQLEASLNEALMRGVIERESLARAAAPNDHVDGTAANSSPPLQATGRQRRRVGAV